MELYRHLLYSWMTSSNSLSDIISNMIKQLSSKIVYQNKWMTVREDEVEFQNKQKGIYSVVDTNDFAMIAPFDKGIFTLVKLYRYPTKQIGWEFPAGSVEKKEGESKEEAAKRELKEETGLTAGTIKQIGFIHSANGFCSNGGYIFLATNLKKEAQHLDSAELGMKLGYFSQKELEEMIIKGEITDSPTISTYGLLKIKKII